MPKGRKCQFPGGKYPRIEKPFSEIKKRPKTKKLASKSKKLELNCTNLTLNSKKTHSDCAKTPDPSVTSRLHVKNKTRRVLLDSESSGDLLFMKKGSSERISVVKRVVPQSWGLPMAPSSQTGWVTLKSLLWSTRPSSRSAFSRTL